MSTIWKKTKISFRQSQEWSCNPDDLAKGNGLLR